MQWGARGTVALVLSALLGLVGGTAVALHSSGPDDSHVADPASGSSPSGSPEPTPAPNDPLGLGVPLENLPTCTGQTILVVGYGETRGALSEAVSANKPDVRYLDTTQSCNTLFQHNPDAPVPPYVAYLGPFDTLTEPCQLRMSVEHKGDSVTSLKPGVKAHVQCLCVLEPQTFPDLFVGMNADTRDGLYVRALQQLLVDIGRNPGHHVTGIYDQRTADLVTPLQELNALDPDLYGIVEELTWRLLRDRACINYDF